MFDASRIVLLSHGSAVFGSRFRVDEHAAVLDLGGEERSLSAEVAEILLTAAPTYICAERRGVLVDLLE
jgi:hypothetical protein